MTANAGNNLPCLCSCIEAKSLNRKLKNVGTLISNDRRQALIGRRTSAIRSHLFSICSKELLHTALAGFSFLRIENAIESRRCSGGIDKLKGAAPVRCSHRERAPFGADAIGVDDATGALRNSAGSELGDVAPDLKQGNAGPRTIIGVDVRR